MLNLMAVNVAFRYLRRLNCSNSFICTRHAISILGRWFQLEDAIYLKMQILFWRHKMLARRARLVIPPVSVKKAPLDAFRVAFALINSPLAFSLDTLGVGGLASGDLSSRVASSMPGVGSSLLGKLPWNQPIETRR